MFWILKGKNAASIFYPLLFGFLISSLFRCVAILAAAVQWVLFYLCGVTL